MLGCSSIRGFCEESHRVCSVRWQEGRFLQCRRQDAKQVSKGRARASLAASSLSKNQRCIEAKLASCTLFFCFKFMTFRVAPSIPASLRGWASAYRDFRALKACDADISDACIKQALSLDDFRFDVLLIAWRRDLDGELAALGESEFELIAKVDPGFRAYAISCALDVIRIGRVDVICEDWVNLIVSYLGLSDKKSEILLGCYDDATYFEKMSGIERDLLAIDRDYWELTGRSIRSAS